MKKSQESLLSIIRDIKHENKKNGIKLSKQDLNREALNRLTAKPIEEIPIGTTDPSKGNEIIIKKNIIELEDGTKIEQTIFTDF